LASILIVHPELRVLARPQIGQCLFLYLGSCILAYIQAKNVNPLAGQIEHEILETFFDNIDLSSAGKIE